MEGMGEWMDGWVGGGMGEWEEWKETGGGVSEGRRGMA